MPQIRLEGYQISCLTTATRLLEIDVAQLRSVMVRNHDTVNSIYVGSLGVQASSGVQLAPGEAISFDHMDFKAGDYGLFQLYGIAVGGACTVSVAKVYVT